MQSFLGGGRGLFAEGQRRWEPEYTTPAQSRTQRRELFKKAQEGRVALARSQYINSFCKKDRRKSSSFKSWATPITSGKR